MSTSFGLGFNLSNSQKLTPQMQQAIKLLQLSSIELEQEVQKKLDSNPLLERIETQEINADDFDSVEALTRFDQYSNDGSDFEGAYNDDRTQSQSGSNAEDGLHIDNVIQTSSAVSELVIDKEQANTTPNETTNADATISATTPKNNEEGPQTTSDQMAENSLGDLAIDTDWDEVYAHAPTGMSTSSHADMTDYQGATSVSLQDHVRWQLNFESLSDVDSLIADYLIDAMDERGFIDIDLDELTENFSMMASFYQWDKAVDREHINSVLKTIQACEPLGIGVQNLAESLQLQLLHIDANTPYRDKAIQLLNRHDLLVSNNIKQLVQETGVEREEISDCLALIRTLNAAPGLAFSSAQPEYGSPPEAYDIPDVIVKRVQNDDDDEAVWKVELNPETLPKIRVNNEYAQLIKRGDNSPDNVYLRDNLMDARLFIRSIEERNQNLLKVATSIVRRQQAFLTQGDAAMKPMILKDVAAEVELHESTVSRLTTSKSILTPQGLFSLKYFFSSHVSSDDGDVSSTAIYAMLEQLIKEEDPKKPLSDSAIQKHLESKGIKIARRTVAKYREALNIGSSNQRKVKF